MCRPPSKSIICGVLMRPDVNTHVKSPPENGREQEGREGNRDVGYHSLRRQNTARPLRQLECFSSTKHEQQEGDESAPQGGNW